MVVNYLVAALTQLALFSLIPVITYAVVGRKKPGTSLLTYVGLYRPTLKAVILAPTATLILVIAVLGMAFFDETMRVALLSTSSVSGKLRAAGFSVEGVVSLLIVSWITTSLSEELLFRGFLCKRLIDRFGYLTGNLAQALIFGALHMIFVVILAGPRLFAMVFVLLFATSAAFLIGHIKEKVGNGSMVPGWIAHGLANTVAFFLVAYVLWQNKQ